MLHITKLRGDIYFKIKLNGLKSIKVTENINHSPLFSAELYFFDLS